MPIFLYGTLRYPPLLEAVLGRAPRSGELTPATLRDATVACVKDQGYPMIRLGTGGQAEGLLLSGLGDADRARLDFYEGGFGYSLGQVTTSAGPADVYLPGPEVGPPGAPWSLDDWARAWGGLSAEAAREVMAHMGLRPTTEVARMFPAIRMRASARLRARENVPEGFDGAVEIRERQISYADFFAMEDLVLCSERFEGGMTQPLRRAVFLGMDAAIVLPYDPVRDRVLLVEQFRLGPVGRSDPDAWLLEPVAGHVDPGETPEAAARREALEEAGLDLHNLELVSENYPSPGSSADYHYVYVGLADLPDGADGVSGVEAEGENIRSHLIGFEDLMEMLETHRLRVGPMALAGYWLARHRPRLRRGRNASS